jgi:SET domain-containing protein
MIHIKYKLDKSNLHGVGLFADEELHKGQLVYTSSPLLDVNISQEQFDSLSKEEQREIEWWGFKVPNEDIWHVDFDVSKFINHSKDGTVTQDTNHKDAYLVAARDVRSGEELTQNYLEFESEEDLLKRGINVPR